MALKHFSHVYHKIISHIGTPWGLLGTHGGPKILALPKWLDQIGHIYTYLYLYWSTELKKQSQGSQSGYSQIGKLIWELGSDF